MKLSKVLLIAAVLFASLAYKSDAQQPDSVERRLRLARAMPAGAMLYLQARDLRSLLNRWLASSPRAEFQKSAAFASFSRSRIYLKLAARIKDFESAIGAGLSEERLAEFAGGASAVAVYDIGNTELVFATELPRERAVAAAFFKQLNRYEERRAEGANYYVAQLSTDAGRLKQQFCFTHANGTLFLSTSEGLMTRVLRNLKDAGSDSLFASLQASAGNATGFSTTDLTLWLNQVRLNDNRYFTANWIHRNKEQLADIDTALIDLRLAPAGLMERRWFMMKKAGARGEPLSVDRATALLRYAPAGAQLVKVHGADEKGEWLRLAASQTLFGRLVASGPRVEDIPDRTRSGDTSLSPGRFRRLDSRFDRDVDDDLTVIAGAAPPANGSQSLVHVPGRGAYCEVARSRLDPKGLFIGFDRALIVDLEGNSTFDRAAFESAITDEVRSRYLVSGAEPRFTWQEEGDIRFLGQSLMEQAAAYTIAGGHLVLGSNRAIVADCLRASSTPAAARRMPAPESPFNRYGVVRIADAKPLFDKLMSILDGRVGVATEIPAGDEDREISFFSEIVSSLIGALSIREMRVSERRTEALVQEQISYLW